MTRAEIIAALAAIEAALAERITIVREIIEMDGTIGGTYQKTIRLPRHNERKTP